MQEKIIFKQAYVVRIYLFLLKKLHKHLFKRSSFSLLWLSEDPGCAAIFFVRTTEDIQNCFTSFKSVLLISLILSAFSKSLQIQAASANSLNFLKSSW